MRMRINGGVSFGGRHKRAARRRSAPGERISRHAGVLLGDGRGDDVRRSVARGLRDRAGARPKGSRPRAGARARAQVGADRRLVSRLPDERARVRARRRRAAGAARVRHRGADRGRDDARDLRGAPCPARRPALGTGHRRRGASFRRRCRGGALRAAAPRAVGRRGRNPVHHLHLRVHRAPQGHRGHRQQRRELPPLARRLSRGARRRPRVPRPGALFLRPLGVRARGGAHDGRLPPCGRRLRGLGLPRLVRRPFRLGRRGVGLHAVLRRHVPRGPVVWGGPAARPQAVLVLRRGAPPHDRGEAPLALRRGRCRGEHLRPNRVDGRGHVLRDRRRGARGPGGAAGGLPASRDRAAHRRPRDGRARAGGPDRRDRDCGRHRGARLLQQPPEDLRGVLLLDDGRRRPDPRIQDRRPRLH